MTTGTVFDEAAQRLVRLPMFAPADYLALNGDVAEAGIDPVQHALVHGCAERRPVFKRDQWIRALGEAVARTPRILRPSPPVPLPSVVTVLVSSWSEPAVAGLAAAVAADLAREGVAATVETELLRPDTDIGAAIVVAPHAFFRLGLGPGWRGTALPRTALMLNTAPLVSDAFVAALPFLLAGRGVLDLSPQTADVLARADIPALAIRPCLPVRDRWLAARDREHPLLHALPAAAQNLTLQFTDPRPIDIAFQAPRTPRRDAFWARVAAEFADLATFVHFPSTSPSLVEQSTTFRAQWRFAGHLAARSTIALQIGADELPQRDWWSTMQAMAAGAVVVSEGALLHPNILDGIHVFTEEGRHIPDLARWLLADPDGRAAAAAARVAAQALVSDPATGSAWVADAARLWGTA